jgi:hypothetical protein
LFIDAIESGRVKVSRVPVGDGAMGRDVIYLNLGTTSSHRSEAEAEEVRRRPARRNRRLLAVLQADRRASE